MKSLRLSALVVALLAGAAVQAPWAADAPKPAAPASQDWRDVSPDNLVLIETKYGTVAVELSPEFAPNHVARMRKLLRAHFYDGLSFYRVIDGFVAQGGADQDTSATADAPVNPEILKKWPQMKAELDAKLPASAVFTPLGNPDLVAPEVGHVNGFPAAIRKTAGRG
jgi:peptidylprolyl isomerase